MTEPQLITHAESAPDAPLRSGVRADALYRAHHRAICVRTDHLLAGWLVAQWATALVLAFALTFQDSAAPGTPEPMRLPLTVLAAGSLCVLPAWLALRHPGQTLTRHVIAAALLLFSTLFIHLVGGHGRMEFHLFASFALLAFYRDWRVSLPATLIGLVGPLLELAFWPQTPTTVGIMAPWALAQRGFWLVLGNIFLIRSSRLSVGEMRAISASRAALHEANEKTRSEVRRQTARLAAKEEQYRRLFEEQPTPMILFAPDTLEVLAVNDATVRTYGYARAEFTGMRLSAILAADAPPPTPEPAPLDAATAPPRRSHHLTASGHVIDVEYVVRPARFAGRDVFYLAVQDVTRRLQMERLVAAQNEVMMSLAMTESVATATGQVLDLICERFDWELGVLWLYDEPSGQYRWAGASERNAERYAEFLRRARANELAPTTAEAGDFWSSGEVITEDEFELLAPEPAVHATGREGLGIAIKVPMQNGGRTIGLFEFFAAPHDATARERATSLSAICAVFEQFYERTQMIERLKFLGTLVETSADAIFSMDGAGLITAWNGGAARIYGYDSRDILGRPFLALVAEDEREAAAGRLARVQAGEPLETKDGLHLRQDGRAITVNLSMSPLRDAQGAAAGISCIARDVTEQKRLEGQLSQVQKLESIGQLAAGIAHEINTPTQYVGDNLSFLQEAFDTLTAHIAEWRAFLAELAPESIPTALRERGDCLSRGEALESFRAEIPDAFNSAADGVRRIAQIVGAMKEFSHPGSRDRVDADLNHAILSTVTVARGEWKYWAEVVTDLDPALPPVPCLIGELNQVVLNLIINASHAIRDRLGEAAEEKGLITVATRTRADRVELSVTDTGTGIPEAVRGRIFDPFFTTKEVGRGTGQGLAIAHDVVVTKHGGRLTFETEPGVGTTFLIELPLTAGANLWQEAA